MRILMLPVLLSSLTTAVPAHQFILIVQKQYCNKHLSIEFYEADISKDECKAKIQEFTFTATDTEEYIWAGCFDELPNPPDTEEASKAFINQLDMGQPIEVGERKECLIA